MLLPPVRLIPARAGKTCAAAFRWACRGAHPRACGENIKELVQTSIEPGSSPRVRGKRLGFFEAGDCARLIPARAGKTSERLPGLGACGAHPRACGENGQVFYGVAHIVGSSPRVRGKHPGVTQNMRF